MQDNKKNLISNQEILDKCDCLSAQVAELNAQKKEIKKQLKSAKKQLSITKATIDPNQISYSKTEEWINRISHLVSCVLAIIGSIFIIVKTSFSHNALSIVAVSIYAFTLIVLYLMSTLYHYMRVGSRARLVFRRFDHCSISLLIAGTYMPFMLISVIKMSVPWAIVIASIVAAMAILTVVFEAIDVNKFKVFSLIAYVVMGWACLMRIDLLFKSNLTAFIYLLIGGIIYTIGVIFYRFKSIPYNHAIFHFFVTAGSVFHFIAVLYLI